MIIYDNDAPLFPRDISWLYFNYRVLQEAKNTALPLLERLKFLAIFSSNLDEFYRVRIAYLRSVIKMAREENRLAPEESILEEAHKLVDQHQNEFGQIFRESILPSLEKEGIQFLNPAQVTDIQKEYAQNYFDEHVRKHLEPIWVNPGEKAPELVNSKLYLVAPKISQGEGIFDQPETCFLFLQIPTDEVPRFIPIPDEESSFFLFLDDLIRLNLHKIDEQIDPEDCFSVKLSRDADLYLEIERKGDLVEKVAKSLNKRFTNAPSRFLYDTRMPALILQKLTKLLHLADEDLVAGGRYHNFNDFFKFNIDNPSFNFQPQPPLPHPSFSNGDIFTEIEKEDQLIHPPYQNFDTVVQLLQQACQDEEVKEIHLTVYRLASKSLIAESLLEATRLGKKVSVFIEVQARFDEEANLYWGNLLKEAGAEVNYSITGLKVHAKIFLIVKEQKGEKKRYAYLGTGNFNEKTAKIYTDHGLLTCDPRLTKEVRKVFRYLEERKEPKSLEHLLVAPFTLRDQLEEMIAKEIENAKAGKKAYIHAKMNSLEDKKMIKRLYKASQAGVEVRLIIRGICCIVPGIKDVSENIEVISIVDRYLEHGRIYIFGNGGKEKIYLASADWMKRNLSRRVEVAFPIYDKKLRKEMRNIFNQYWNDNVKARIIDQKLANEFVKSNNARFHAQHDLYEMFKSRVES